MAELSSKLPEEILLQKYYAELVRSLARCIDEVLPDLVSNGIIDIDQKNVIKNYGDTPADKAEYLLDNYIARPLYAGMTDGFMTLLNTMKKFPSCSRLVVSIEKNLQDGGSDEVDYEQVSGEGTSLDEIAKKQDNLVDTIVHLQEEIVKLHEQSNFTVFRVINCGAHYFSLSKAHFCSNNINQLNHVLAEVPYSGKVWQIFDSPN